MKSSLWLFLGVARLWFWSWCWIFLRRGGQLFLSRVLVRQWRRSSTFLHWSSLVESAVAASLPEQLSKVRLAVEDSIKSGIGWGCEEATPMRTPEAWFMVKFSLHRHLSQNVKKKSNDPHPHEMRRNLIIYLLKWVYGFLTQGAFVLGPREHGGEFAGSPRLQQTVTT